MSQITVINQAAEKALKQAWIKAYPRNPQEPDYVAALTCDFVNSMQGIIPGVLFGGIFIHQSPFVNFISHHRKTKSRCELGDLLIVCHKRVDSLDWYNAALLQWKKTGKPTFCTNPKSNDAMQLELYQEWPTFTITRNKKTISYDILPKTVTPGAQYGIFYPTKNTKMYVDMPAWVHNVNSDYTFGRFVWNMINWETGRPIDPDRNTKDGWSNLIWDLMRNSINARYNRKRICKCNCNRVKGDFFDRFFPIGPEGSRQDFIIYDGGDGSEKTAYDGDDGGAISLILIDIDKDIMSDNNK